MNPLRAKGDGRELIRFVHREVARTAATGPIGPTGATGPIRPPVFVKHGPPYSQRLVERDFARVLVAAGLMENGAL